MQAAGSPLADRFARPVADLRVSLTDRCNFRCVFCHNEGQGLVRAPRAPAPGEMSTDEVVRLLHVAQSLGVQSAKLTGGEPLVRSDVEEIVFRAPPGMEMSLTTNASLLAGRARALKEAGLRRVNVSLHAPDAEAFRSITRGSLPSVMAGVGAALEAGLTPVKLNMVVFRPTLPYVFDMVEFVARTPGTQLQLIQFMPELVAHREWMVPIEDVHRALAARAESVDVRAMHHRRVYHVRTGDGRADVEIVDPVGNAEFCANCHRLRVTATGHLKGCLNRNDDLVPTRGLSDDELAAAFRRVVAARVPYYGAHLRKDASGEWVPADPSRAR
ncbi:MAG TPA: GTP 3',8-cyclase MoaA [Candidatus Thermoplasmatota archaeon]|nr:GTP 3',8-cyclase MoaA [Candidatus Thermoplasmatota archaeon]